MITLRLRMFCVALVATLSACGPDPAPKDPSPLPPVKDTFAGDMVGSMDKARAVEATTLQHKDDLDRAVKEAE